jgi:hypothetical protein
MIDKNGKEIKRDDKVQWPKGSYKGPSNHVGHVVALVPKGERVSSHLILADYKQSGYFVDASLTSDRVFVSSWRPKSKPLLYAPRPSSVEVIV